MTLLSAKLRRFWLIWQDVIFLAAALLLILGVWRILDQRRYPFREGLPAGWHWVEQRMSVREFFTKEGLDPRKLRGMVLCSGAAEGYTGDSRGFPGYLRSRLPREVFANWTRYSYTWDAQGWEQAEEEIEKMMPVLHGLVILLPDRETERILLPGDYQDGGASGDSWAWSWKAAAAREGEWREIDSRYGAEYGVIRTDYDDLGSDHRRLVIRSPQAERWLEDWRREMGRRPEMEWPEWLRTGSTWSSSFTLSPDKREVVFKAWQNG